MKGARLPDRRRLYLTVAKISLMVRWNIRLDANFQPDLPK
jgi:hypothetical protein